MRLLLTTDMKRKPAYRFGRCGLVQWRKFARFFVLALGCVLVDSGKINFILVTVGENQMQGYYIAAPYYSVAFDTIAANYPQIIGNSTMDVYYQPGPADCSKAADAMYDLTGKIYGRMRELDGLTVLMSHGCSLEVMPLADFAREVNVPVLASAATDIAFTNRKRYPTFLGFGSTSQGQQVPAIRAFLRYHQWTTITLFCDDISAYPTLVGFVGTNCRGLMSLLSADAGYELYVEKYDSSVDDDYTPRLLRAKSQSRIFVILTRADQMRKLMVTAYQLNMTNKEFVYISPMCNQGAGYLPLEVQTGEDDDEIVLDAYKYVIKAQFTLIDYNEMSPFLHKVAAKAMNSYSFTYDYDELHNEAAVAIPEMLFSVAKALNGSSVPANTIEFLDLFLNRTFSDGTARNVVIGPLGMRFVDTVFYKFNTTSKEFEPAWVHNALKQSIRETSESAHDWDGALHTPLNRPICGYQRQKCFVISHDMLVVIVGSILGTLILLVVAITAGVLYSKRHNETERCRRWLLQPSDIEPYRNERLLHTSCVQMAKCKNQSAWLRTIATGAVRVGPSSVMRKFVLEVGSMNHRNIGKFFGLVLLEDVVHIVWAGERETLQSFFFNKTVVRDGTIQAFFIFDVVAGLHYIHQRRHLRAHGSLSSQSIVVDNRFVAKINDTGSIVLSSTIAEDKSTLFQTSKRYYRSKGAYVHKSQEADVFALGVVICEILLGRTVRPDDRLASKIGKSASFAAFESIKGDGLLHQKFRSLLQKCCSPDASSRPSITSITADLKQFHPTGSIVENLLDRLKRHAERLEETVLERTEELLNESKNVDALLSECIPQSLVSVLRNKQAVHAALFESVTIYFSSMVGFDDLCKQHTPMEVSAFLNELYILVDKQLANLDVYKVETVKDGYVVASGVPISNDTQHVFEIAKLALRILHNCVVRLKFRIGMHTGPIAAGIVGWKMPRYCLFGDTMNTASRMESHGEGSRIHLSLESQKALSVRPGYLFQSRGIINVKGKGPSETFWLLGLAPPKFQREV